MNKVLFTSDKMDWSTPQWLFDKLNEEFNFDLDTCANKENVKCMLYIDEETNALIKDWAVDNKYTKNHKETICWMNPSYGRGIGTWMKKAYEESLKGCVVVCLVPARTDTKWWWQYTLQAYEIRFIKGRLKFGGADNCAPFPSAVIIFNKEKLHEAILNEIATPVITWYNVKEKSE